MKYRTHFGHGGRDRRGHSREGPLPFDLGGHVRHRGSGRRHVEPRAGEERLVERRVHIRQGAGVEQVGDFTFSFALQSK